MGGDWEDLSDRDHTEVLATLRDCSERRQSEEVKRVLLQSGEHTRGLRTGVYRVATRWSSVCAGVCRNCVSRLKTESHN
jgi:hypothetical protein